MLEFRNAKAARFERQNTGVEEFAQKEDNQRSAEGLILWVSTDLCTCQGKFPRAKREAPENRKLIKSQTSQLTRNRCVPRS
jgi:hypothetical protein